MSFISPAEHVTEIIVMGNQCTWLQLTKLVLLERLSERYGRDDISLHQTFNRIPCPGNLVYFPLTVLKLLTMTLLSR